MYPDTLSRRRLIGTLAIPLLWSLMSGLTVLAMGSSEAFLFPLVALTVLFAGFQRQGRGREDVYQEFAR